jgi:K+-sensing histidine kinase KdpD
MPSIILSAYLGGLRPGMVSTVLGALGTSYLLLPPPGSVSIEGRFRTVQWFCLIASGCLVSVLCEGIHREVAKHGK